MARHWNGVCANVAGWIGPAGSRRSRESHGASGPETRAGTDCRRTAIPGIEVTRFVTWSAHTAPRGGAPTGNAVPVAVVPAPHDMSLAARAVGMPALPRRADETGRRVATLRPPSRRRRRPSPGWEPRYRASTHCVIRGHGVRGWAGLARILLWFECKPERRVWGSPPQYTPLCVLDKSARM